MTLLRLSNDRAGSAAGVLCWLIVVQVVVFFVVMTVKYHSQGEFAWLFVFAFDLWPALVGSRLLRRSPRGDIAAAAGLVLVAVAAVTIPLQMIALLSMPPDPFSIVVLPLVLALLWIAAAAAIALAAGVIAVRRRHSHAE